MKELKKEALNQGYDNVVFIRVNTGEMREVSQAQVDTVNDVYMVFMPKSPRDTMSIILTMPTTMFMYWSQRRRSLALTVYRSFVQKASTQKPTETSHSL